MSRLHAGRLLTAVGSVALLGCSRFPASPELPEISPGAAGKAAIAQYDINGDGQLDDRELEKSPPLTLAKERIDANGDGMLTADEITARIKSWLTSGTTITSGITTVTLNGKELEAATVTFEPEPFLGPGFQPCRGVTDDFGRASVTGADAKFPGIYVGLYRIKISKEVDGKETIPARYNTETALAWEAADDIPGVGLIEFKLQSP